MEVLIGTYSKRDSEGIYSFNIDTNGKISNENLFCKIKDSKYLCYYNDLIFTVFTKEEKSGVAVINKKGEVIAQILYEDIVSSYIAIIDGYIYTANYKTGQVSKLLYKNNKLEFINKIVIKELSGAHMVLEYKDKLIIPCLLIDKLIILDKNLIIKKEIKTNKGQGPRHAVLSKDNRYLYLVCELSCELLMMDTLDDFKVVKSIQLTNDFKNNPSAAAIRLSEDKNTLYVSTRGVNIISVIDILNNDLKLLQTFNLTIDHPRDILNIFNDEFLLVSGMNSDKVLSYKISNRIIEKETGKIIIPEGVSFITI